MKIFLNVKSTPAERYDEDWQQALAKLLRENSDEVFYDGGGADMHAADNIYFATVKNQKAYSALCFALMEHGYTFTHWTDDV